MLAIKSFRESHSHTSYITPLMGRVGLIIYVQEIRNWKCRVHKSTINP